MSLRLPLTNDRSVTFVSVYAPHLLLMMQQSICFTTSFMTCLCQQMTNSLLQMTLMQELVLTISLGLGSLDVTELAIKINTHLLLELYSTHQLSITNTRFQLLDKLKTT